MPSHCSLGHPPQTPPPLIGNGPAPAPTSASPPLLAAWIVCSREQSGGVRRWQTLFTDPDPEESVKRFRQSTYAGSRFGSQVFVDRVRRPRKQPKLSSPPRPGFAGRTHPALIFHEKVRCDGSGRPASCPAGVEPRPRKGKPDVGAYEFE